MLLAAKPAHLIVNKVPVVAGKAYWTLQNSVPPSLLIGFIMKRNSLVILRTPDTYLRIAGSVPELDCYVPFHPERCVPEFAGFYFAKQG